MTARALLHSPRKTNESGRTSTKDEVKEYLRSQNQFSRAAARKDASVQVSVGGTRSPILNTFLSLAEKLTSLPQSRELTDWAELASRFEELSGVLTLEELLGQFAFHFTNHLEKLQGRENRSVLSSIQEAEMHLKAQRLKEEYEAKLADMETRHREELRFASADAIERSKQTAHTSTAKEFMQLKLEQALYNSTLSALREEVSSRDAVLAQQTMELQEAVEHSKMMSDTVAALQATRQVAIDAAIREASKTVHELEAKVVQLSERVATQAAMILRYGDEIQRLKAFHTEQLQLVERSRSMETKELLRIQESLETEMATMSAKHAELTSLHSATTTKQMNVLANLAKNNMLMVERQHKPRHLKIHVNLADPKTAASESPRKFTPKPPR